MVHQGGRDAASSGGSPTGCPTTPASRRPSRRTSSSPRATPGYFLVVADFINWAKRNGIRVGPGRGSGAGSMCAYAMGITDLDPIPHGLIFERFLNPERMSMPDFDVDFDERRRGEVIRYVTEKYGEERVAQIVTYGTIKAKQAVKDASPRPGPPVRRWVRSSPRRCRPTSWARACRSPRSTTRSTSATTRAATSATSTSRTEPHFKEIVDDRARPRGAQAPVGRARRRRHHVAASRSSTSSRSCAGCRTARSSPSSTTRAASRSGLVKMDFLGLRNLTILDDAIDNVKANRDEDIDLDALSKDMTDQRDLRPARPRRHPRRLPARRWRHAHAAAA